MQANPGLLPVLSHFGHEAGLSGASIPELMKRERQCPESQIVFNAPSPVSTRQ